MHERIILTRWMLHLPRFPCQNMPRACRSVGGRREKVQGPQGGAGVRGGPHHPPCEQEPARAAAGEIIQPLSRDLPRDVACFFRRKKPHETTFHRRRNPTGMIYSKYDIALASNRRNPSVFLRRTRVTSRGRTLLLLCQVLAR